MPLRVWNGRALVYIYRPQRLQADLKGDHSGRLLESRSYSCSTPGRRMMQLMERLSSPGSFLMQIGLFLGYPPEDVEGFIRNKTVQIGQTNKMRRTIA